MEERDINDLYFQNSFWNLPHERKHLSVDLSKNFCKPINLIDFWAFPYLPDNSDHSLTVILFDPFNHTKKSIGNYNGWPQLWHFPFEKLNICSSFLVGWTNAAQLVV